MKYLYLLVALLFLAAGIYQLFLPNPVMWFAIALYAAFSSALAFAGIFKKIHLAIGLVIIIFVGMYLATVTGLSGGTMHRPRIILLLCASLWLLFLLVKGYLRSINSNQNKDISS